MIVKCKKNTNYSNPLVIPNNILKMLDEANYVSSTEWYTINSRESGYALKIGCDYVVYGILIYKNEIRYLIINEDNIPGFFPSDLFDVVEHYILFDWGLNVYNICLEKCVLIISENIIADYTEFKDLVNNETNAIKRFWEYKNSLN